MKEFGDHAVFLAVLRHRSFSGAARELGISRSYASRRVAALEARLGSRLLHRTTRRVSPTAAGEALSRATSQLFEGLDAAERHILEDREVVAGRIRVSLPAAFGNRYLGPVLADFQRRHPRVALWAHFSDSKVDLVEDGYDLVVRGGTISQSSLIVRRLWSFSLLTVAAPSYLDARGRPDTPEALAGHACLRYLGSPQPDRWRYEHPSAAPLGVTVSGPLLSNSPEAILAAAEAGLGVARLPDFLTAERVASGDLERLLHTWTSPPSWFSAVMPHRDLLPLRVRRLIEHLASAFEGAPWVSRDTTGRPPDA